MIGKEIPDATGSLPVSTPMSDFDPPAPDNPNPNPPLGRPVPPGHQPPRQSGPPPHVPQQPYPPPPQQPQQPYGPPPYGQPPYGQQPPYRPQGALPPVQHAAPPRYGPPAAPRSAAFSCFFVLSLLLNVVAFLVLIVGCFGLLYFSSNESYTSGTNLIEKHHSGKVGSKNKVAIITLDGVIMEGSLSYMHRQIEQAEKDDNVKAIVLRINSPGGSITASEDLHRRLTKLTGYDEKNKTARKPLVVHMGSMAASGGYYVAMPAQVLYADRTTITGSIGVYASFPNIDKMGKDNGFKMIIVKQGEIKDSGSPFKEMNEKEAQVWQDMVDHAYNQFLDVVLKGRANLSRDDFSKLTRDDLLKPRTIKPVNAGPKKDKPAKDYTRYLADGGIWTADDAEKFGLIDHVGTLDDAIADAKKRSGLGEDSRAVLYEKPKTLADALLGVKSPSPNTGALLDPQKLSKAMSPRLWYLAPGADIAGILAAAGEDN
jgi:protease IV